MHETNRGNAATIDTPSEPPVSDLPILAQLRIRVTDGTYGPGDLMPETALASEFNVSRTPIREALKQLENEGLVEIQPRVGTFVRIPTTREIVELFQVKESLEGLAAGLLARRGSSTDLTALHEILDASDAAVAHGDAAGYARLVHEFHWTIIRGADNNKLLEHYERLMNQLAYHRIVLSSLDQPGRMRASNAEHRLIVAAIAEKDPVGAEFAMRGHVEASSRASLRPAPHDKEATGDTP